MNPDMFDIVLASSSPRRKQLLESLGISFRIIPPEFEEKIRKGEEADAYVKRNAFGKANQIFEYLISGSTNSGKENILVIGADTIVVCDQDILEKPKDESDARRMLERISGRSHKVMTGVSVAARTKHGSDQKTFCCISGVWIKPLSTKEISDYIQTKEPMDKAGSYGIQGRAAYMVQSISGSYSNIVGLPLTELWEVLCWFTGPRINESCPS